MENNFFADASEEIAITKRLHQLKAGKVGLYSVGLYPASLAYNCAMHSMHSDLLLAPRPKRDLLGAFSKELIEELDPKLIHKMINMASYLRDGERFFYSLRDLIEKCEIVILSSNSNHIESDLRQALSLRNELNRNNVLLACLVGSFTYDEETNSPSLLSEKYSNLAFFSGFHRHGALRNPADSFTANFCHPDPLNALLGARLLDKLSPNIQVSPGIHNVEAQYVKAAKNMSSILAGFAHTFHKENPGLLPTLLTLLLNQCLDQAATVAMRKDKPISGYIDSSLPITEIGYGVQKIEAALSKEGSMHKVRDHTFIQLTPIVADVNGSMMLPITGLPTRNFQVGQILANNILSLQRCPLNLDELITWCKNEGLSQGALEGINSLQFWPEILKKYSISYQDSSMINLLYMSIYSAADVKKNIFEILTNSRNLTRFCQESVMPESSSRINMILDDIERKDVVEFISHSVLNKSFESNKLDALITSVPKSKELGISNIYYQVKISFDNMFM